MASDIYYSGVASSLSRGLLGLVQLEQLLHARGQKEKEQVLLSAGYLGVKEQVKRARELLEKAQTSENGLAVFLCPPRQRMQIASIAKQIWVKEFTSAWIDFKNIETYFRLKKAGKLEQFKDWFLEGGDIEDFSQERRIQHQGICGAFARLAEADPVLFERKTDEYLLAILKKHSTDIFCAGTVAWYYYARLIEAKNVSLLLINCKTDTQKTQIKGRLRNG